MSQDGDREALPPTFCCLERRKGNDAGVTVITEGRGVHVFEAGAGNTWIWFQPSPAPSTSDTAVRNWPWPGTTNAAHGLFHAHAVQQSGGGIAGRTAVPSGAGADQPVLLRL